MIHIPYHIKREHKIVFPVDERQGQLLTGQLADGLALIDVGNLLNTNGVMAGDEFSAIGDEDDLSGNVDAEVSTLNATPVQITSVAGSTLNFADPLIVEENSSEDRFFEFKITRPSPWRVATFGRDDQTHFVATGKLWVNGAVPSGLATTNPSGQQTRYAWGGNVILFTPLGSGRWSITMDIVVDGHIEVVIPDGANPDVELRLSNIEAIQDTPIWTIASDAFNRLGPWITSRLQTITRVIGDRYALGGIPVALQALGVNVARHTHPSGSTAEVLVTILSKENGEPVDLTQAVVFYEGRNVATGEVVFLKSAEVVSAGVVKFTIPADEADAGTYRSLMTVHLGGVPDVILRTDPFLLRLSS